MKKVLVIKASSRLGMKYFPHGSNVLNIGVEEGPEAVLESGFLERAGANNIEFDRIDFTFSKPEDITDENYYKIVAEESDNLAQLTEKAIASHQYAGVISVGGDHGVAFATVLGIIRGQKDKRVGVIDFDSHGDIHLKNTSPSGNFHGMWVRPFFGKFDEDSIARITDVHILPAHFLYIGNLLLEQEEERFIAENNIQIIDSEMISRDEESFLNKISRFCDSFDSIHITFDIDVFKQDIVSATGTPNPNGFSMDMILKCIERIVASNKLFSLDVVEVNPKKDKADQTIETAQKVIEQFIFGFNK